MLTVKFINRDRRPGNFSIEQLFDNIRSGLAHSINIENYWFDPKKGRLRSIIELKSAEADVFHITGDVNFLALGLPGSKTVITVHDVGYYENPVNRGIRRFIYKYLWLKWPLTRCARITTVSTFTRDRLVSHFPELASKVSVVPNPIEQGFSFRPHDEVQKVPVVLCMGTGAHKNMSRFMKALEGYKCRVIIIGRIDDDLAKAISDHKIEVENHYGIAKEELNTFYNQADVLLFASLYEGFGLPIVEAQACGLPVITSSVAAMPDTAGYGAILVDPLKVDEIKAAVVRVLEDVALRKQLIENGKINARRYSIEEITKQYLELYKGIGK